MATFYDETEFNRLCRTLNLDVTTRETAVSGFIILFCLLMLIPKQNKSKHTNDFFFFPQIKINRNATFENFKRF